MSTPDRERTSLAGTSGNTSRDVLSTHSGSNLEGSVHIIVENPAAESTLSKSTFAPSPELSRWTREFVDPDLEKRFSSLQISPSMFPLTAGYVTLGGCLVLDILTHK